jgi:hypothetical protein
MTMSSASFFLFSHRQTASKSTLCYLIEAPQLYKVDIFTSSCQNSAHISLICLGTRFFSGNSLRPLLAFNLLYLRGNFLYTAASLHHFSLFSCHLVSLSTRRPKVLEKKVTCDALKSLAFCMVNIIQSEDSYGGLI